MLKFLLIPILACLPFIVQAQLVPAEGIEDAVKQAQNKCERGCLVLSPEEIAWLQDQINQALEKAYQAGIKGWASAS